MRGHVFHLVIDNTKNLADNFYSRHLDSIAIALHQPESVRPFSSNARTYSVTHRAAMGICYYFMEA
jgi:hypothetical protein